MTYKLIEECGLKIYEKGFEPGSRQADCEGRMDFVSATDLEAFLSKAVRVYSETGKFDASSFWGGVKEERDQHQALLINIEPIPKLEPVTKEELRSFIENAANTFRASEYVDFLNRIEKAGLR